MSRSSTVDKIQLESRRVERAYSTLARVYDDVFERVFSPGRHQAVSDLGIRPGDHILEVGVGTGLTLPLYPPDCAVTGVDISEPMLQLARQRLDSLKLDGVELKVMDARQLLFPDEAFDHVLALHIVSVVPEPERVMREVHRVLKPGGTAIVVNKFRSAVPFWAVAEKLATPLVNRCVAFRLDLPADTILNTPGLELVDSQRVNLFGLWRLLKLSKTG